MAPEVIRITHASYQVIMLDSQSYPTRYSDLIVFGWDTCVSSNFTKIEKNVAGFLNCDWDKNNWGINKVSNIWMLPRNYQTIGLAKSTS